MTMLEQTLQKKAIYLAMMSLLMLILKQISTTILRAMMILSIVINEPSLGKGANETGNSCVNRGERKSGNIIPKLIDNKRAHLEKKLSANQRESILLTEAKQGVALRRKIINSFDNTNEFFLNAMTSITDSFKMLCETMVKSTQTMHELFSTSNSSDAGCSTTAPIQYQGGDEIYSKFTGEHSYQSVV